MTIPRQWVLKRTSRLEWIDKDGFPTPDFQQAERFVTQSGAVRFCMAKVPEFLSSFLAVRADIGSPRTDSDTPNWNHR